MSDAPGPLVFLDANVLAKPVTRTLLIYASNLSDYAVAWSEYVEAEAERNLRPRQAPVRVARRAARLDLSPQGRNVKTYVGTKPSDRQVLADAVASGAAFIVTEDVDDFDEGELISEHVGAVNPDLFLSERATAEGYREAVSRMAAAMADPPRTPEELHARLGRQHPRTVARHGDAFNVEPLPATHGSPAALYRGDRCLRCLQPGKMLALAVCSDCRAM
jgi:hypothetical protein